MFRYIKRNNHNIYQLMDREYIARVTKIGDADYDELVNLFRNSTQSRAVHLNLNQDYVTNRVDAYTNLVTENPNDHVILIRSRTGVLHGSIILINVDHETIHLYMAINLYDDQILILLIINLMLYAIRSDRNVVGFSKSNWDKLEILNKKKIIGFAHQLKDSHIVNELELMNLKISPASTDDVNQIPKSHLPIHDPFILTDTGNYVKIVFSGPGSDVRVF